ncbi:putative protein yxaH [Fibrisoma limi BUZ 3]|uniref:DUF418 domain-containing protein n=1 Tax=Fibrisoma limi BUZ 3 TaxID=1185876 RepID=I2GRE7_9BACT|nr:DUF418 domain-containing protein [Fibrisoma limi]CCH56475.1 putative protein yxaH [Fibrisoma limi BUZ 3]
MEPSSLKNTDRIQVIDALRGFALIGIIVAHSSGQFLAGPSPATYNILFSPLDKWVNDLGTYLTFGKFFTIFSFLFGLSFAIQMDNAAKAGRSFAGRTRWRLVILFAIGFIHSLFYSGDILRIYAVLGLLLIVVRRLPNWAILMLGTLLVLNAPLLVGRLTSVNAPPPTAAQVEASQKEGAAFARMAEEGYRIKSSGTLADVITMNAREGLISTLFFQLFTGRLFITFGLFLLGLYVGRKRYFTDSPAHRQFFRRLFISSGLMAVVSTTVAILTGGVTLGPPTPGWQGVINLTAFDLHQASLSAFYVAAVTLLFWQTKAQFLRSLVAVGRMGLTTYLCGTAFGVLVFLGYGLGQIGKLGMTTSVGLGLAFFALQIPFSNWWLSRYQFGPVEWLWRSLTYGKAQPWRKKARLNQSSELLTAE